ncbi:MAG: flagellin [Alphaproteobacteria bacterium]|nr:flagellin [Alphaproteobacteria bacterium]
MKVTPSFLITALARSDLTRITSEMYDLQRQTASGFLSDDLKGYAADAGRLISARSVIAQADARKTSAQRLQTRIDIQDVALDKAADAMAQLKIDVMTALSSDNGSFLAQQLRTAFNQTLGALNQTYEGVSLFSGEHRGAAAIRVAVLEDLPAAVTDAQVFNESVRDYSVDLGMGAPFAVAEKASTISREAFNAMRALYNEIQSGTVTTPLNATQRAVLTGIAAQLDAGRASIVAAQGRNGDANARLGREIERLTGQSDLVQNHMDQIAGSDLAEVAMRMSATTTQYEAIAKVFSDIRNLTLVNFLD